MAASADAERALAPIVGSFGVDLEGVEFLNAGRRTLVRVVIDRDGGVDLDTVAQVSSAVSQALDDPDLASVAPGPFVLEVTSPGVDRPLVAERHWRRAIGRRVEVTRTDGSVVSGRLATADAEHAVLLTAGRQGSSDEPVEVTVAIPSVRRAVVQVEFGPIEP